MNDPIQQMLENLPAMVLGSACHFLFVLLTSWPGLALVLLLVAKWIITAYQRFMRQIERMDQPRRGRRW